MVSVAWLCKDKCIVAGAVEVSSDAAFLVWITSAR